MATNRETNHFLTRRILLGTLSCAAILSGRAWAQEVAPDTEQPSTAPVSPVAKDDPGRPFSFDALSEEMRHAAESPDKGLTLPDSFLNQLNYDAYKLIRFNPERARFDHIENTRFLLQAFHMGWLYSEPVRIYEVADGTARLMGFDTDDFMYERQARDIVPEHVALPGVAGFRLHTPLNRPDVFDELVAFQGASYFRALGRYSSYGLSARGLAVNTGMSVAEEFPRFSRFWVSRPQPGSNVITVWAAMNSASLTGAYQFVITPGQNTTMDVTARLFFRADVQQLGIAPLTSMFLYNEMNRTGYDDYRPQVHDNDGLGIIRANGEHVWRPLANPARLASSYFVEPTPKSFGLFQRDRDYESYQDPGAVYERRPSCSVEPTSDWGKGMVRLVEIPSDYEVNDNIVAFWVPDRAAKAGEMHEYSYRLSWGDLPPDAKDTYAYVAYSSSGLGGVSGVAAADGTHKFVVDFKGGLLRDMPADKVDDLELVATASRGEIVTNVLHKVDQDGTWRAVIDVRPEKGAVVELSLHIAGYDRKLTETWLYQWMPA